MGSSPLVLDRSRRRYAACADRCFAVILLLSRCSSILRVARNRGFLRRASGSSLINSCKKQQKQPGPFEKHRSAKVRESRNHVAAESGSGDRLRRLASLIHAVIAHHRGDAGVST
jgi:hypothetical protein